MNDKVEVEEVHRGLLGDILHILLLYQSLSSKLTDVIENPGNGLWVVNRKLFLLTYAACGSGKYTVPGYELKLDPSDDNYTTVGVIKIY